MTTITCELVRKWYDYDPETGVVTYKRQTLNNRRKKGDVVGSVDKEKGYRYCQLHGKRLKIHRVVWLWMTGEWPKNEIDHKNRIRDDNRWDNLRDVTHKENQNNQSTCWANR